MILIPLSDKKKIMLFLHNSFQSNDFSFKEEYILKQQGTRTKSYIMLYNYHQFISDKNKPIIHNLICVYFRFDVYTLFDIRSRTHTHKNTEKTIF